MKPRNTFEVKGAVTAGALVLALFTLPAVAEQVDGHAFVRASILNTWTSTAVSSPATGKMDAHEHARNTIVGVSNSPSGNNAPTEMARASIDSHDQARRLLLAQPLASQGSLVVVDPRRTGS